MSATKYILLSVEDTHLLANTVRIVAADERCLTLSANVLSDTGGDFEEIAGQLKAMEICAACYGEGQQKHCQSLDAQRTGRRIGRLIERAKARSVLT